MIFRDFELILSFQNLQSFFNVPVFRPFKFFRMFELPIKKLLISMFIEKMNKQRTLQSESLTPRFLRSLRSEVASFPAVLS